MDICGYAGNILHVDLTSGQVRSEELNPELARSLIGGYGIANKLTYDLVPADVEPFAPENLIIFGTGPFAGTLVPGAAKILVTTKFPVNNAFATAAGGGNLAWLLKSNGYDFAVIGGQASHPVYLNITEDGAEIHDAGQLWGKDTYSTADELRRKYPQSSIVPIGTAGENLVKISITSIDKAGTIGSGGLPAVMGAKKLKAVVVQQGNKEVRVADPVRFMRLFTNLHQRIMKWPGRERLLKYSGTGPMPESRPEIAEIHARTRTPIACISCPLADKEVVRIKNSRGKDLVTSMTHFSAYDDRDDDHEAEYVKETEYQDAINRYGLCTHQFLNALRFIIHLYQSGVISREDTGGLELKDDFDTVMRLMKLTAYREGVGVLLADGVLGVVRKIGKGTEAAAVHIKGRAIVRDPRLDGLGTMEFEELTTPRGAHVGAAGSPSYGPGRSLLDFARHSERMGAPPDAIKRIVGESDWNPGRLSRYSEDWFSLFGCLSLCNRAWVNRFYHINTITDFYTAVTGIEATPAGLMRGAERAWTLHKLLNVRAGFSRKDDKPPEPWFQPLESGGTEHVMTDYYKTKTLTRQDIENLLDDYYDERRWDVKTGIPTPQKLRELGLTKEASDLEQQLGKDSAASN